MTTSTDRNCTRCNGTGITIRKAFIYDGRSYPEKRDPCYSCNGQGTFSPPNAEALIAAVMGRTVKHGRRQLRSKRPDDARAYYVWRLARFHGGADVTMPMTASMDNHHDPFIRDLDAISEAVAKLVFGTDMAGAHRWGRALGHLSQDIPGLPASAYSAGPVADADKPEEEQLELY